MLEGVVRVIRAGGKSAGALKVGDALQAGDVIFASAGTSFQLTGADGQLWTPPEGGLPADQATGVGVVTALADMRKALLAQGQASLDEAVARLNQATEEDAPAAGLSGGATGALAEGLRVGRVQESVGTQEYAYDAPTLDTASEPLGGSVINGDAIGDGTLVVDPANPNLAPITGDDNVTTDEDTAVSGQIVGSDVDGDALTYALGTGPSNGTVSVNANGSWTYTPSANFNGSDSFTVSVSDGNGGVTTATVNVGVTPVNDAPVASADSTTTVEDTPVTIDVLGNDTDVDGPTLSIKSATVDPAQGSVSIVDGKLVFTPAPNFAGSATITYVSTDGSADSAPTAVTVTVTPVNDAPVAANQAKTTAEDTPVTGTVVASDVDGDTLSYSVQSGAAHGTLTLNATTGDYTYTPAANYNGTDSFTVRVSDGKGGLVDSVVNVTVTPVNDAPVANNDSLSAIEDTAVTYTAAQLVGNDTDIDGTNLKIASVTAGNGGSVVLNANGTVTFTPNANFNGTADFTYTVTDGELPSAPATVTVAVSPVNDAPVAANQAKTTAEDTPVTGKVVASDVDGDTLSYAVQSGAAHGTLALNTTTGDYTYTPAANYNGTDSFTVRVSDGKGGFVDSIVNVTITPVNDAPVVTSDNATIPEDTVATGNVLSNDSDVEGSALTVTQFSINGTTYAAGSVADISGVGTVTIQTNGDYTFTPVANWSGSVPSVVYTVTDGSDASTGLLALKVTPVADVPTINAINNIYMLLEGNTTISTGSSDTPVTRYDSGAGVSHGNLELELGVASGYLDNRFDPTGQFVNDPGFVNIIDG
ncbi:MAG: tandem-95 repeat protein, partial [Aquabacterium sp.]|nr:tandem-95 repeat protein [Aquabacterium sp.]